MALEIERKYLFGVTNTEFSEQSCGILIDTASCDDQRTEKVAFAALVNTSVRSELFGRNSFLRSNSSESFKHLRLKEK